MHHQNSRDAWKSKEVQDKVEALRAEVFEALHHRRLTGSELNKFVRSPSGHKRLSELRSLGLVRECGKRKCQVTGHTATVWAAVPVEENDGLTDLMSRKHLTLSEAANKLGTTGGYLRNLLSKLPTERKPPAHKINHRWWCYLDEMEEWWRAHKLNDQRGRNPMIRTPQLLGTRDGVSVLAEREPSAPRISLRQPHVEPGAEVQRVRREAKEVSLWEATVIAKQVEALRTRSRQAEPSRNLAAPGDGVGDCELRDETPLADLVPVVYASREIGVSVNSLRTWMSTLPKKRKPPLIKVGNRWWCELGKVKDWHNAHQMLDRRKMIASNRDAAEKTRIEDYHALTEVKKHHQAKMGEGFKAFVELVRHVKQMDRDWQCSPELAYLGRHLRLNHSGKGGCPTPDKTQDGNRIVWIVGKDMTRIRRSYQAALAVWLEAGDE